MRPPIGYGQGAGYGTHHLVAVASAPSMSPELRSRRRASLPTPAPWLPNTRGSRARVERHGGAGGRRQERTKGGATPLPDVPGPGSGAEQTALSALVTPCSVAARALCSHTSKHLGNAASRDLFPQRNFVGRCDVNVCRVRLALRLRLSPRVCRHVPPQGMVAGVRRCRPR